MKKKILQEHDLRGSKVLAQTETARIIQLNNGSILKFYHQGVVEIQKLINIDVEAKILAAEPIKHSPEILIPTSAVYLPNGKFCGYIMPRANGIDFNSYDDRLTVEQREDLSKYAEMHYKLESILRRNPNIVFPDFCTCDNIFVDSQNNIQLIDYDGLQVGAHRTLSISTSLGESAALLDNPKYCIDRRFFTKEVDKKSSIILFYLTAFNIDLNKVGMINPCTGRKITLDDIFQCLNLDDPDICHKTYKIFNDNQTNEYLGKDIFNLAEKYNMHIISNSGNISIKRLTKKK